MEIGDDRVGKRRNLVLQHQLAFFQARNFDFVDRPGLPQRFKLSVESAMFGFQQDQYLLRIVVVHRVGLAQVMVAVTHAGILAKRRLTAVQRRVESSDRDKERDS